MSYRFRLTFFHSAPGFLRFEEQSIPIELEEGHDFNLTARNADKLVEATKFHIEGRGYLDESSARRSGERLRVRLRVLNAMLALGISVPIVDSTSGGPSSAVKKDILEKTGGVALDTIVGLAVFPDDDKHFEYVMSGDAEVYPGDPHYLLRALQQVWAIDMDLDEKTEDALNILNISTTESSPRAKFLTAFLALERMIDRSSRSEQAKALLEDFQKQVNVSRISDKEKTSIVGSLARLREESFSTALMGFADRVKNPIEIKGKPIRQFFSECIDVRNKIAHNATLNEGINLQDLSEGLRQVVLSLIWTTHGIPSVSIDVPASTISFKPGGLSIRVL